MADAFNLLFLDWGRKRAQKQPPTSGVGKGSLVHGEAASRDVHIDSAASDWHQALTSPEPALGCPFALSPHRQQVLALVAPGSITGAFFLLYMNRQTAGSTDSATSLRRTRSTSCDTTGKAGVLAGRGRHLSTSGAMGRRRSVHHKWKLRFAQPHSADHN